MAKKRGGKKAGGSGGSAGGSGEGIDPGRADLKTRFRPGNPIGAATRFKKAGEGEDASLYSEVPDEPDAPQWLRDMWHVYHRPKGEDRTAAQRDLRRVREKDFRVFLGMLKESEKEWRRWGPRGPAAQAGAEVPAAEQPVEDAGSRRVGAVLEKLLRDKPWLKGVGDDDDAGGDRAGG